jgi:sporulation protein YlmC with PRC-barrel domain
MQPKVTMPATFSLFLLLSFTFAFTLSPARPSDGASDIIKASTIIGTRVQSLERKDIGEVKDLAIDEHTGEILYAVLSFGGLFGIGDKYFAVPWEALDPTDDAEYFLLNVKKTDLSHAPGFDKDNWPDFADPENYLRIYEYYELPPPEHQGQPRVRPDKGVLLPQPE